MSYSANGNAWLRGAGFLVLIILLLAVLLGMYWSSEPEDSFSLSKQTEARVVALQNSKIVGVETTLSAIKVADTLLYKPGGFLANDIVPPGVWLDNIPSWEYGALIQLRDLSKAMRESFSRSQSQSTEDVDLALAEPRYNFDHKSWMLPASEAQYEEATSYLHRYLDRLVDSDQHDAQFYARADNLRNWLRTVETRLGSLSQRLSASVGQRRINTDLAGESGASQSTPVPTEVEVKTPWLDIDNVFYEARGSTWALLQFLRAMEQDFGSVLAKKNALVSLKQIIRELEAAQEPIFSPMIVNGSGFGVLANHSLVMASYVSRANAGIIDLRELLSKG